MRTRSKLSILLSVLLCCTMLAGLLPTVAFAEDGTTVSSEDGTATPAATPPAEPTPTPTPAPTPAAEPSPTPSVAWIEGTGYPTLAAAVDAAESGATIVLGEEKFTLYKKMQYLQIQQEKTSHLWGREPIKPHGSLVQSCLIRLILGQNTMAIIVSTAPAQSHFGI